MTYEPKFGDVLEHGALRGVVYMLLHPVEAGKIGDWIGVCLKDDVRQSGKLEVGQAYVIGSVDAESIEKGLWLVLGA